MRDSGGAFQGYAYGYPHKTAYRRFQAPIDLAEAWAGEELAGLFLYAHVPFCEMRCGFCNLFTTANAEPTLVSRYLDALQRQTETVARALGARARLARVALGGGTPTFLSCAELARLLGILGASFPDSARAIPKSVEVSPATVCQEQMDLLLAWNTTRISIGVQSFIEAETRALGRPQKVSEARRALALLRAMSFRCLNLDLIYGMDGQTSASWRRSLEEAMEFGPDELYLYPLYIRPLTGLGRRASEPVDNRLELYRVGRDFLLARGYRQISMRLFRANSYRPPEGPVYCCQEDGMVGLGAGARSYTSQLHYSSEYAVGSAGVRSLIERYSDASLEQFGVADYGYRLNADEQRRRYLVKSLLRDEGLEIANYQARFGSDPFDDFPQLSELLKDDIGLLERGRLCLTAGGLELSDVIGPWLCSAAVRRRMEEFVLS